MYKLSDITSTTLKPIITKLYSCLFDSNEKFTELKGFTNVVDHGIKDYQANSCRGLSLRYNGIIYELEIFNYVRPNGNTIAISKGKSGKNYIQYVLDKFIEVEDEQIIFTHDGIVTGAAGKTRDACISEIESRAPYLIDLRDNEKIVVLGSLEKDYEFNDSDFQDLIANLIEYTILRHIYKSGLPVAKINSFHDLVEGYRIHVEENDKITSRFSIQKTFKNYVWITDFVNHFSDLNCHYELITRDQKHVNVEIHFEDNNKEKYYNGLENSLPQNAYWNNAHLPSKSIAYSDKFSYDDPELFDKIDEALLYLDFKLGNLIKKIKDRKYSLQEMEEMFRKYIEKVLPTKTSVYPKALAKVSLQGKVLKLVEDSIYEIQDSNSLDVFCDAIKDDLHYKQLLLKSHNAESAALKKYDQFLNELNGKQDLSPTYDNKMSLNQILYGPPGTGKTYSTITKAVAIVDGITEDAVLQKYPNREDLKKYYNGLFYDHEKKEGQIAFTTFHQSMSYEEFVEGIKPNVADKAVVYDIKPGIFQQLAETATSNWLDSKKENSAGNSFEEAFLLLKEEIDESPNTKFSMKTKDKDFEIIGFTDKSIQFKKASGSTNHTLSINTLRDNFYGKREVRETGVGIYYPAILERLRSYSASETQSKEEKRYVLIIDEINRGNVSAIFGELITLLEPDKRLGEDEALEVILPYSQERFSVPSNLYIIGTMNTADRSVEALDSALRRRFSFTEILPNPELLAGKIVGNIKLDHLLQTINDRVEILLDRDHTIGHSYFIKIGQDDTEGLKEVFKNCIIPLLQEYFYNDYEKIGMILGQGFFEAPVKFKKSVFATFDTQNYPEDGKIHKLKTINESFDIINAVEHLLGQVKQPVDNSKDE